MTPRLNDIEYSIDCLKCHSCGAIGYGRSRVGICRCITSGIRIGVGLLMTLGVALGGWWTARMNTQSSTGLLYVGLGTALAGEISARVLFFLTGAAV